MVHIRYFKACMLNKIKQPRKQKQDHQPETSSEGKNQIQKLPQQMIAPQKREAFEECTSTSEDDRKQCKEETIMEREANTNTKRDDAPVQRGLKAELVEKISSEQV